jgi:cardiolipin synthase
MIEDIASAKKSIYLETYIFANDSIGKRFREALIKKAREGVKVRVLIDALGSGDNKFEISNFLGLSRTLIGPHAGVNKKYFKELIDAGGEVRFFKEIQYVLRIFSKNHERNHRKLLIIDDYLSYLGSINITKGCLGWRELVIRIEGYLSLHFRNSFLLYWRNWEGKADKDMKRMIHRGYEILHDLPGKTGDLTADKYIELINGAEKEILIETPYFIPPIRIRRAIYEAVKRGVIVKLLIPHRSDLGILDLARNRYLGRFYKNNVKIFYYLPRALHSKLLIVDDNFFLLGSSNLDYRSFLHDHEINLIGQNKQMLAELKKFYISGLSKSKPFDYSEWKQRSPLVRIKELFFRFIEDYL